MCINCFGNHEAYHGTCRNCRITVESTKFYTVFDDNN